MESSTKTSVALCHRLPEQSDCCSPKKREEWTGVIRTYTENDVREDHPRDEHDDAATEPLSEDLIRTLVEPLNYLGFDDVYDQWPVDNETSFSSRGLSSGETSDDNRSFCSRRESDGGSVSTSMSDSKFNSDKEKDTKSHEPERKASEVLSSKDVVLALQGGTVLFENELIEVRPSAIGGVGAFAKRPLSKGDVILVEQPLFMSTDSSLFDDFKGLDRAIQKVALSLHKNERLRGVTPVLKAVWSTNNFATRHNMSGLFAIASRFNHACHPGHNVDWVFNKKLDALTLTVRKDQIDPGEELTICYGKDRPPRILYMWYGFRCCCGTCPGLGDEELKEITEPW